MTTSQRTRRHMLMGVGVLCVGGLALVSCAEGGGETGSGSEDLSGETVRISGGITGIEAEWLQQSFEQFTEDTGIIVEYTGDKGFEGNIVTQVTGGSGPDIAIVPQPGILNALVETGSVIPGSEETEANVDEYWSEDWKAYGTIDDVFYAAPMLANIKGYIFYSPAKFEEWGVEVPTTWDEMLELTQTIRDATGQPPWCAGFESGAASGWPGTDWVEDLVLRQAGPDVYDQWVAGDVTFEDPEIKEAFEAVGEILLNPEYVNAGYGDVRSINSTAFGDVAAKVADGSCPLTHQGSFLTANFAETKTAEGNTPEIASDGDIYAFIMPGLTADELTVEVGGEFVTPLVDNDAVKAVTEFMSTPEFADARVSLGGNISANLGADPTLAVGEFLQEAMTTIQDPDTTVRFDASDLMPAVVGSGSFFKGMVDWVDGRDLDTVLSNIQAGYEN